MQFLTPFLALVASAACADIEVFWHHAKSSSQTSLSVFDGSTLVARTCSSIIAGGTPQSLDFSDLDDNGFGNFSVGDTKYLAHSNPEYSGGPICTKKYNADVAVVACSDVPWSPSADAAPIEIEENCHEDEDVRATIRFFTSTNRERANVYTNVYTEAAPLIKRNVSSPQCNIITSTGLVGDGNPHQNFFDKQISENLFCGAAPSCSVGHELSTSYTIGWSASASAAGWITGGFEVQQSWTTGDTHTCYGGPGDTVCVWYNTAHTAYTVQNGELNTCENEHRWSPMGGPFVMYSPNRDNRNGDYYCVVGTCRAKGDAYWDYSGRAGGP